jgi:acyl carrier protein
MKSLEEFVDLFAEQFDETDASVFTPETKFRELDEWSSLLALSIIAMVDDEFDVTLKGDDIRNSETIEDLFNLVKSKA